MAYFVAKYIISLNKNAFCFHYFQNNMYIAIGINHCMSIMKTDTLIRHIILRQLLLMAAILASTVIAEAWEVDSLASRLDMQRYLYPQEKIHVSTDIPGTSYPITVEGLTDQGEIIAKSAKIRKQ